MPPKHQSSKSTYPKHKYLADILTHSILILILISLDPDAISFNPDVHSRNTNLSVNNNSINTDTNINNALPPGPSLSLNLLDLWRVVRICGVWALVLFELVLTFRFEVAGWEARRRGRVVDVDIEDEFKCCEGEGDIEVQFRYSGGEGEPEVDAEDKAWFKCGERKATFEV